MGEEIHKKTNIGGLVGFFIGLILFISVLAVLKEVLVFQNLFNFFYYINFILNSYIYFIWFLFNSSNKDMFSSIFGNFLIIIYDTLLGIYLVSFYEKSKRKSLFWGLTISYFVFGVIILFFTIFLSIAPHL